MSDTSQRQAVKNHRSRRLDRGLVRFDVLGRDADRELVRSPGAWRKTVPRLSACGRPSARRSPASRHGKAESSKRCGVRHSLVPTPFLSAPSIQVARLTCEPVHPRYQHHQRCHKTLRSRGHYASVAEQPSTGRWAPRSCTCRTQRSPVSQMRCRLDQNLAPSGSQNPASDEDSEIDAPTVCSRKYRVASWDV